jgi:hypothetical protein
MAVGQPRHTCRSASDTAPAQHMIAEADIVETESCRRQMLVRIDADREHSTA